MVIFEGIAKYLSLATRCSVCPFGHSDGIRCSTLGTFICGDGFPSATHGTHPVRRFSFGILCSKQCAFDCHDRAVMRSCVTLSSKTFDVENS